MKALQKVQVFRSTRFSPFRSASDMGTGKALRLPDFFVEADEDFPKVEVLNVCDKLVEIILTRIHSLSPVLLNPMAAQAYPRPIQVA